MEQLKIISWNVNGLRSVAQKILENKGSILALFQEWNADIVCLQETKVDSIQNVDDHIAHVDGYESFWCFSKVKKGISGVSTYIKKGLAHHAQNVFGEDKFDREGRVVRVDTSAFVLFNVYFPNAGRGPERLAYKLEFYKWFQDMCDKLTKEGKRVIVVGDVNTTHTKLDFHFSDVLSLPNTDPAQVLSACLLPGFYRSQKTDSPFTKEEVNWITSFINDSGFCDTFRHLHPEERKFSWWDPKTNQRPLNNGYRIDFSFVHNSLVEHVAESDMLTNQGGSDHCPLVLTLRTSSLPLTKFHSTLELSSDKIKKKQPKLMGFFTKKASSAPSLPSELANVMPSKSLSASELRPPDAEAPLISEPKSAETQPSNATQSDLSTISIDGDDNDSTPKSKRRKLTDFFAGPSPK